MASPRFSGFPDDTFAWFDGLERDNSKAYFTEQRAIYDAEVRGALELMLTELAAEFGGEVKLFRQNRDVRFSANKSPYKTATYGVIHSRPDAQAPFYAQLSSGGLFAGSGFYVLESDQLERFRLAIADDARGAEAERAVAAVEKAGVEVFGESLKTAPRGFARDHPRARLLRHKALFAGKRIEPADDGVPRRKALAHVKRTWEACSPINEWLLRHVGPSLGGASRG
ncbi:MAG: DUF2461 domain-containing protein [Solirubrobacteraceae bacterium]